MAAARRASVVVAACASGFVLYYAGKKYFLRSSGSIKKGGKDELKPEDAYVKKKPSPAVDKIFLNRLLKLLRISIPGLMSKEFALLVLHTSSLVARTFLSIYVATLDGKIVKSIVDRQLDTFLKHVINFIMIAIPATFVNSLIRYLENKLALAIRTRLVDYAYSLYFKDQTYYRVSNLDGRLANPDHSLTEDLQAFSSAVAHIYSHVSKPLLDVVMMSIALARVARKRGETSNSPGWLALGVVAVTGYILRLVSPPFGKLVAEEARRNGYLRYVHSRLITNAEEIAFYGGHLVSSNTAMSLFKRYMVLYTVPFLLIIECVLFQIEHSLLRDSFAALAEQMSSIFRQKLWFIVIEQFLMKYLWALTGIC